MDTLPPIEDGLDIVIIRAKPKTSDEDDDHQVADAVAEAEGRLRLVGRPRTAMPPAPRK